MVAKYRFICKFLSSWSQAGLGTPDVRRKLITAEMEPIKASRAFFNSYSPPTCCLLVEVSVCFFCEPVRLYWGFGDVGGITGELWELNEWSDMFRDWLLRSIRGEDDSPSSQMGRYFKIEKVVSVSSSSLPWSRVSGSPRGIMARSAPFQSNAFWMILKLAKSKLCEPRKYVSEGVLWWQQARTTWNVTPLCFFQKGRKKRRGILPGTANCQRASRNKYVHIWICCMKWLIRVRMYLCILILLCIYGYVPYQVCYEACSCMIHTSLCDMRANWQLTNWPFDLRQRRSFDGRHNGKPI
jgi:hypothetical protein